MKKFLKVLWILAACMACLGVLVTALGVTWSLRVADRLTPEKSVPVSFPMDMLTVQQLQIDLGVGDVQFIVDDEARIEATGFTADDLSISQNGGAVNVAGRDPVGGTHLLNLGFFRIDWLGRVHVGSLEKRMVTVYLPQRTYLDTLDVDVTTGDVTGELSLFAENASFDSTTGDLTLEDFSCTNLLCGSNTGNISLDDVTSTQYAELSCNTGDLTLTDCKWHDFSFNGSTGMLALRECSADNSASFHHRTDDLLITGGSWNDLVIDITTGNAEFAGHLTGDCRITATTGSVKLTLDETHDSYTASLRTSTGDADVKNAFYKPIDKKEYAVNPGISAPNSIEIDVSTGDITLIFAQN